MFSGLLESRLRPGGRVLLTTHENPDGDGLGSAVALAEWLESRHQQTRILVYPEVPENLLFLDPGRQIEAFSSQSMQDLGAWPDLWILLDASDPRRMGEGLEALFRASSVFRVCIDHHLGPPDQGFGLYLTDPKVSSTAELIYAFFDTPPSPRAAQALYAALVVDTGSFRHSCTTPKVHRIAAELLELGVQPDEIYQALYHQESLQKLSIFSRSMQHIQLRHQGHLAYTKVSQQDLKESGADYEDLEGLVEQPLRIKGVEVSALVYEAAPDRTKLSLRSRRLVDVHAICQRLGGGGHRLAAGARVGLGFEAACELLEQEVALQLQRDLPQELR